MDATPEHSKSTVRRRPDARGFDALIERFARHLCIDIPTDLRPRSPTAGREWDQGVEAERVRALALLREVRAVGYGPGVGTITTVAALHIGIRKSLDAAERWGGYYHEAGESPGRFVLLARAEVESLLACELRELADGPFEDVAA